MSQVIIQSLPIIAKALGRNMGVKVVLDAGRPRTDGEIIYLPSLPLNDPGVEALGLGYIIHEAGHIRYSDFTLDFKGLSPLEKKLCGVFEDIRMERCVIRDYPGAPKRLSALVEKLVHKGFFKPINQFHVPVQVLVSFLLFKLRAYVLDQPALETYANEAETRLKELVTDMAMSRIRSVMARVTSCKTEKDTIELAQEMALIMKEESERTEPPKDKNQNPQQGSDDSDSQNQSQSDDDGDGQEDDSADDQSGTQSNGDSEDSDADDPSDQSSGDSDDTNSDSDDDSEEDATDTGNGAAAESDDNSDAESTAADGGSDDDTDPEFEAARQAMKEILESSESELNDVPGDISDAFEELLKDELKEASEERGNHPISMQPTEMNGSVQPNAHQKALDEAEAATSALQSRLIQLVQSQTKAKRRTSRYGRRLNDRKLHRIKAGNTRVYKSVSRKKAVNTTVQVLLDRSYSMNDGMPVALQSTLALTAAMKKIPHLSVGSAFFPGLNDSAATVLTDHEQQMYQTAGYYPMVRANGCTPLLEALMWSGDTLVQRKEERKVLIVITDGTPDGFDECQKAISDLKKGGIEVYGLGIDVNLKLMTELFDGEMTVIENVGELAQATFSLLESKLIAA